jgi:hypothetical protein
MIRLCSFRAGYAEGWKLVLRVMVSNVSRPSGKMAMESGHAKQHRQSQLVGFQVAP